MIISRAIAFVAALLLFLTAACQHTGHSPACGKVVSLSGTSSLRDDSKREIALAVGASVHAGRIVSVSPASRLVIDVGNGKTISAAGPTQFVIDSLEGKPPLEYPIMRLISGELYLRTLAQVGLSFVGVRPAQSAEGPVDRPVDRPVRITPSVDGTQFSLVFVPASRAAVITVVSGIVGVKLPDAREIDVPSCFKLLVKSDGTASNIIQTVSQDFQRIALCAGASADSLERLTFCKQVESEPVPRQAAEPPKWLKAPNGICEAGKPFFDTLAAKAFDGGSITYKIISGPQGMTVDGRTGIIRFVANKPGAFDIQVSAEDSSGSAATTSYRLSVLKKNRDSGKRQQQGNEKNQTLPEVQKQAPQSPPPSQAQSPQAPEAPAAKVMLDLPSLAQPGDTVLLDASRSRDAFDSTAPLAFRFDADGDGVWDVPPASGFSNAGSVNHVYGKEGVYKVIAEVQTKSGRTARAEGKIMVRIPPTATIEIRPPLPVAGSACTLDAKKSTVSILGKQSFVARWDLDNNGTWDVPANGGFASSATTAIKTLDGPGPFRVVLQVKDEAGLTSKAIAEIPITPVFKVILLSMPDTALADIQFTAACQTSYPPSEIAEYDWDFNGDGIFEVKQEKHLQTHEYKKPGTYKVSCRAVARNGNQSVGTRTIVVAARSVFVKARVPQQAQALVATGFDGEIAAHRTRVEQVGWDFDGDGTFDWSSPSSAKTKHAFAKPGTYHPVLRAISTDKREWRDTAAITVTASVPPRAVAGKNILAKKGDNVDLEGTGVVTSGKIILYEWDFDNDGTYDWKSEKTGSVSHKYLEFSRPVLRVTAESGATATDTLTVVICPDGMIGIKQGPFCIDRYEFPNAKGQVPVANVTYAEAEQQCKKENKRLCTSDEWERACSGTGRQRYPQPSSQYSGEPCNVQTRNSPGHIAQSGSFEDCKTPYGAGDMNGNVAEWTAPVKGGSALVYGGTWLFPVEKATCSSKVELKAGSAYPYVGFRCCK